MKDNVTILDAHYGVSTDVREELLRAAGSAASWEIAMRTPTPGVFPRRVLAARALVRELEENLAGLEDANEENDARVAALLELRANPRILRAAVTGVEPRPRDRDELPRVMAAGSGDEPRVATLCATYLRAVNWEFSAATFIEFLRELQGHEPLLLREIWQIPAYLRFTILEGLLEAADDTLRDGGTDAANVTLTLFASLRAAANMEWVSVLEPLIVFDGTLRRDPAGT